MIVAQLQQDDWQRLKAIRLHALRESPDAFGSTEDVETSMREQNWRERLVSDQEATFIASMDRRDVGLVVGAPYPGTDAARLFAMWVAPDARRSGVGRALVSAIVDWARRMKFARLLLDVTVENTPAIALYERTGFMPTGHADTLPPPRTHIKQHRTQLLL